jgi:hypothetical protein
MDRQIAVVLYVVAMVAIIVGVELTLGSPIPIVANPRGADHIFYELACKR